MANNRLVFEGLDQLYADLRKLPAALAAEATGIVQATGERAFSEMYRAYPVVTGNLRDHLKKTELAAGPFGAAIEIRNTAAHAHLFEHGTEARHYVTRNGVKHLLGRMPPGKVFSSVMPRHRRAMLQKLKDLVTRQGLEVSGHAD